MLNTKYTTYLGLLVAVVSVVADNAHMLPEDWGKAIALVGAVVAAVGKSLLHPPTPQGE